MRGLFPWALGIGCFTQADTDAAFIRSGRVLTWCGAGRRIPRSVVLPDATCLTPPPASPGRSGSCVARCEPHARLFAGGTGGGTVANLLLPAFADDLNYIKQYRTYNARSETAAKRVSFRKARNQSQHCIVSCEAIYEPDWRTGEHSPRVSQQRMMRLSASLESGVHG